MEQDSKTKETTGTTELGTEAVKAKAETKAKTPAKKTPEVEPEVEPKVVRLILVDNNRASNSYRSRPYLTTPIWSTGKNKYLTGYEDLKPVQKATRERTLKLDPDEHYPIYHMMKLDLSKDRDLFFYEYLLTQPRVAHSKAEADARSNYFYFYIEDREAEAEVSLNKADDKFEAEMLIRQQLPQGKYRDIGIWLGADVRVLTDVQLKDYLVGDNGVCRTRPSDVIAFFAKTNSEIMFVRKLSFHNIIWKEKKGRGYYDDPDMQIFLGMSEGEVVSFMQKDDNRTYLNRWREDLKKVE